MKQEKCIVFMCAGAFTVPKPLAELSQGAVVEYKYVICDNNGRGVGRLDSTTCPGGRPEGHSRRRPGSKQCAVAAFGHRGASSPTPGSKFQQVYSCSTAKMQRDSVLHLESTEAPVNRQMRTT